MRPAVSRTMGCREVSVPNPNSALRKLQTGRVHPEAGCQKPARGL